MITSTLKKTLQSFYYVLQKSSNRIIWPACSFYFLRHVWGLAAPSFCQEQQFRSTWSGVLPEPATKLKPFTGGTSVPCEVDCCTENLCSYYHHQFSVTNFAAAASRHTSAHQLPNENFYCLSLDKTVAAKSSIFWCEYHGRWRCCVNIVEVV